MITGQLHGFALGVIILGLFGWPARANAQQGQAVDVLPTDRVLSCQPGMTLHIAGTCPFSQWTQEARLEVDRHVVAKSECGAMDGPFAFTWTMPTPGQYVVEVTYVMASGERAVARHLTVRVLDEPPLDWRDGPHDDDNDYPVTLHRLPLKNFRVAQASVVTDGLSVPVDPLDFSATIPGGSIPDGVHQTFIEAYDPDGNRYVSPPCAFGVPPRLDFPSPGSLVVRALDRPVALRAKVCPLWKPVAITYYVNDVPVASSDHAPFLAYADLSAYDSGTYLLKAMAVDEAGHIAETPAVQTAIINIPRERAQEAREQAANTPPMETIRPPARPAVASDVPPAEHPQRAVHGVASALNAEGTELMAVPVTVGASLHQGTGRFSMTGIADDGALAAGEVADSWLRLQSDPSRDWSHWDDEITVETSGTQAVPDGVTDALALHAALTGQRADPSVMVIGNVTETGMLVPTGSLMTKADYALSHPGITTVVVADSSATSEELGMLSRMKPSLLQGKRIVTARTMDDVLRIVFGSRAAQAAPRRSMATARPAPSSAPQMTPLPPLLPPAAPERAARPNPEEDPLNAQLDQWQALYERNAATIQSFANQVLHRFGGH